MNPNNQYGGTPVSGGFDQSLQQQPQQPAPQPIAQPQHSGNFLTHLLPTAGSILGALLAPETGGLSLLASAGLGAAGAAGGKALENATEGKSLGNDVLTAGAEGGIGTGVGGAVGKVLGRGAEALGSRATNITNDAKAATDLAKEQQSGVDFANATKNNYAISPKLQGGDHLALGSNQDMLTKLGYDATDPYQMAKAAEAGYHPNDLSLNGIYNEALQNAKPVNMSDFGNQVFDTMKNTGTTDLSSSPLGNALQDFHGRTNGTYGTGSAIDLPENMNATDVRKLQQSIGKEMGRQQTIINNAENNGLTNVPAESAHQTLGNLYEQLGTKIKTPEVDQAIATRQVSPDELQQLTYKFGDMHGKQIADTINNAQGAQDLLDPMKSYTQMSQAGHMGIDNIENKTGTAAAVARSKADINGDGIADVPTGPTALEAAHGAAAGGGHPIGMIAKFADSAKNSPTILNTLSRISALGAKGAKPAGAFMGTAANLGADPVGGTTPTGDTTMQPPVNNDLQNYIQAMEAQGILGTSFSAPATQFMATIAPQLQKNRLIEAQLQGMPGLFANAGGAQGIPGILSHISGLIPGTAANTYESHQADIAHQLGIDARTLPSLMQNQQSAGMNQGILSQLQGQLVQ